MTDLGHVFYLFRRFYAEDEDQIDSAAPVIVIAEKTETSASTWAGSGARR
jgi:hypothetical protein